MQKNWYVFYTRPKCEKKVANVLAKRNIESFCPLNRKPMKNLRKSTSLYEPLFNSYVFVKIVESDIPIFKKVKNVVSLVYWKNKLAIINEQEIQAIKEFTAAHQDIKLERSKIDINTQARNIDGHSYTLEGKLLMIRKRSFNVNLPSLGLTMIAEMEIESIRRKESSFDNRKLLLQ